MEEMYVEYQGRNGYNDYKISITTLFLKLWKIKKRKTRYKK